MVSPEVENMNVQIGVGTRLVLNPMPGSPKADDIWVVTDFGERDFFSASMIKSYEGGEYLSSPGGTVKTYQIRRVDRRMTWEELNALSGNYWNMRGIAYSAELEKILKENYDMGERIVEIPKQII